MAWSDEQAALARTEGWRLVTTIDSGDTHPFYDVAGVVGFATDQEARAHVLARARSMSRFHQDALHLVAASRIRSRKK